MGTAGQGDARVRALPANTMQVVLVRVATAQRTLRIPEESLRHESTSYEALGVWLDACQPVCALFGDRGLGSEWKGTLSNSLPEEHIDKVARSTGVEVDVDVEMGFWSKIADWLREQRDSVEILAAWSRRTRWRRWMPPSCGDKRILCLLRRGGQVAEDVKRQSVDKHVGGG